MLITNKTYLYSLVALLAVCTLSATDAQAQRRKKKEEEKKEVSIYDIDTLTNPVPRQRQLWHDKIDKEQNRADASDGVMRNRQLYYTDDSVINEAFNTAM